MPNRLSNKLASIKEVVCEAYKNGATLREIAEVHGCSPGTVRNALKECGVEMRSRGRRKAAQTPDPRTLPEALTETAEETPAAQE